ncbi:SDR family oxidoreductase [Diaphorobacter sp. HDW4A]|uniref:SDR family NAD(P)-dependent oxidoreductase n=1 Tax=Diaphorobacter sp. HDW4A TaxID=2714924 RepID=UPI001409B4D5|nr:SDR family NAD(P)-dependent oxidoreductase [Diaphorobacter sp. HDW4A]QIL83958.1 SDR family oxidoreductase [Diaphorobacter sp. HDW4A]
MKDKVVVVTGAGNGIGKATALLLARLGAKVVVNDLGSSGNGEGQAAGPANQVVGEIVAAGGQAVADTHSVATREGAASIIQTAVDRFGRIDGVVNNAGILRDRIFHKMNEDEWRAVIDVHLHGSYFVSRAAAPFFKDQESGVMVHMTSTSGLIGNFGQANYAAAKLGMTALSKSIALDMARFNVRSNCIAPFAWSRLIGTLPSETEAEKQRLARMQSMKPEQVAAVAAFLISDDSAEINGQVLAVRGNEVMVMSQPRPLVSVHSATGWDQESLRTHALPAIKRAFTPLERSPEVFSWDPV